jgi:pyruvate formate lyase activating enzyme
MTRDEVQRDPTLCTVCGKCADACPNEVMQRIGREISADELVEVLAGDKVFFDGSGGGVTLSGGEPTLQMGFLKEVLRALRHEGIHTAIETCGFFKEETVRELAGLTDLFLYDLKHMDPTEHSRFTGVSNEQILGNFSRILSEMGRDGVIPRIPLIPGFNTGSDSIQQMMQFLDRLGYSGVVHLMPYNRMAKTKYEKLGQGDRYRDMGPQGDEDIDRIVAQVQTGSFEAVCSR